MAERPEKKVRAEIDQLSVKAIWAVPAMPEANVHAAHGVSICEFSLKIGYGLADYLH